MALLNAQLYARVFAKTGRRRSHMLIITQPRGSVTHASWAEGRLRGNLWDPPEALLRSAAYQPAHPDIEAPASIYQRQPTPQRQPSTSASSTHCIACAYKLDSGVNHGHEGHCRGLRAKHCCRAKGSLKPNLLTPSDQLASDSSHSHHTRQRMMEQSK